MYSAADRSWGNGETMMLRTKVDPWLVKVLLPVRNDMSSSLLSGKQQILTRQDQEPVLKKVPSVWPLHSVHCRLIGRDLNRPRPPDGPFLHVSQPGRPALRWEGAANVAPGAAHL
jgi:hypothetical protein